jgi:hypothetical protein
MDISQTTSDEDRKRLNDWTELNRETNKKQIL